MSVKDKIFRLNYSAPTDEGYMKYLNDYRNFEINYYQLREEINNIQKNKKIVANQKTLKKKGYDDIFLGVLSQEESENIFSNIDYITQIQNDPANFIYSLNLRGFLHYLIHTKSLEKVDKIIQNLLNNKEVKDQFYFLNHTKGIDLILGGKKIEFRS